MKTIEKIRKKNDYSERVVDYLCNIVEEIDYEVLHDCFIEFYYNKDMPTMHDAIKFQAFIKEAYGIGEDITAEMINSKIKIADYETIIDYLERLFLEPINKKHYIPLLKKAIDLGVDGDVVLLWRETRQRNTSLLLNPKRAMRLR